MEGDKPMTTATQIITEFQQTLRHANLGHSTLGGTIPADGTLSKRKAESILGQMDRAIEACAEQGLASGPHSARYTGHMAKLRDLRDRFAAAAA